MRRMGDQLRREGAEWVHKLLSGSATRSDARALATWRGLSPAHEAAFSDALRLRRAVEDAAPVCRARQALAPAVRVSPARRAVAAPDRRWGIGGALAASAAGAAIFGLPVLAQAGVYETGVGERRTLALAPGLSVEMNTRTRLSVREGPHGKQIDLQHGQAVVTAALGAGSAVELQARDGRAIARQARFDVRADAAGVCVTCLAGEVEVRQAGARIVLASSQQVAYGQRGLGRTVAVDPAVVAAWQSGMLVFRNQPLGAVIAEVNRYRSGPIVITDAALARRPVDAVFYIDQMDSVVAQVQQLSGAHAVRLPGGVVLLS